MANNPTLLTMPIAENGQKNTIPATQAAAGDGLLSQSTGFPPETALPLGAGGVAPKREDFNGAFNLLSNIAFYAQKGWVFKWDENQAYFVGCEVIDETDGFKYRCIDDVAAGGDAPHADGAVHWRLVIEGEYIGSIKPCLQTSIPDGWLSCENGQEVLRSAYPELWQWVQTNAPLITEAQWQTKAAAQKSVGYYSSGDGSTTFRLPRLVGFMEGTTAANVGTFTGAGVPNITGDFDYKLPANASGSSLDQLTPSYVAGSFYRHTEATSSRPYFNPAGSTTATNINYGPISFDASRSSAIYGASNTVQPESVGMVWCVRAFGAAVNQGTVDITELAQMLNLKQDKATVRNDAGGLIDLSFINTYTGYAKFGTTSGKNLIIQWGQSAAVSGSSESTATFPISFDSQVSFRIAVVASASSARSIGLKSTTASTATFIGDGTFAVIYIAIGY